MAHLDAQQLSAHLDGALVGRAHDEAERHLRECAECRAAMAEMLAQDQALKPALTHDPGDAYFESFSARVEDRIRAAGLRGAQERGARARGPSLWSWLTSPRRVTVVGAAAATIVGVGIALLVARESPPGLHDELLNDRRARVAPAAPSADRAPALERELSATRQAEGLPDAPANDARALDSERKLKAAEPPTSGGLAAVPQRAQQVRRDERGEIVSGGATNQTRFAPAPPTASAPVAGSKLTKPGAAAMAQPQAVAEEQAREKVFAAPDAPAREADALAKKDAANLAPPAASSATPPAQTPAPVAPSNAAKSAATSGAVKSLYRGSAEPTRAEGAEVLLCGDVIDPSGRPIVNAQISLPDLSRITTTNARGRFCITAPAGNQGLTVMAIGFQPARQQVLVAGEAPTVRVSLTPVSALGNTLTLRFAQPDSLAVQGGRPNEIGAGEIPASVVKLTTRAEADRLRGLQRHAAALLDDSAAAFERALKLLGDGPHTEALLFRSARSRYEAWQLAPNARRARAAEVALGAYLGAAPAAAGRDSAARWLKQLER